MFARKRPCGNCPFRKGQGELFQLNPKRLADIHAAPAFQCHKTVDFDEEGLPSPGNAPQQCAGLMAILHRDETPNQMMQVGERLGAFNPALVDLRHEAYATWADALAAHNPSNGDSNDQDRIDALRRRLTSHSRRASGRRRPQGERAGDL